MTDGSLKQKHKCNLVLLLVFILNNVFGVVNMKNVQKCTKIL